MIPLTVRTETLRLLKEAVDAGARQSKACEIIGLPARTLQRWRNSPDHGDRRPMRVQSPLNRLSDLERQRILKIANSAEFGHQSPCQIVPQLADRGLYIASESTFYRVLRSAGQVKHRGRSNAPTWKKPQPLVATAPNQLYSWDITYLPTTVRGRHYYLYLFLDIFSRKVVGWAVYENELSDLAADVLRDVCAREKIQPGQVILHSDNGNPMKGASMLAMMQELGVARSLSRPAVSNDNPYSESQFRTLKCHPMFPRSPFADLTQARGWVAKFVHWYNEEHRHSGIRFVTPSQRHTQIDVQLLKHRDKVYTAARLRNPNRWSGGTRDWSHIDTVHLNPSKPGAATRHQEQKAA
jgi:transposase InsO family protein